MRLILEILRYIPESMDPTGTRFAKYLAHGHVPMAQMGSWPWHYTTAELDISIEIQTE